MEKPLLWRVCGWFAIGFAVGGLALLILGAATGAAAVQAAYGVALVLGAMPLLGLWTLGTLIHRSRLHRAKINAQAMRAAARQ